MEGLSRDSQAGTEILGPGSEHSAGVAKLEDQVGGKAA